MTSDAIAAERVSRAGECIDARYQLETEIGAGGLGSVYRATQTKLARQVAVKLLHESMGVSDVQRARFEREARSLAALEHPNIVSILDYGVADGQPYIVTELLEGETLAQRLRAGSLPLSQGLHFADELLDALAFMHEAGVVHRDLKASNVFLQRMHGGERVKLLDFGLAKTTVSPGTQGDATLTRDGTVVGTPAYMSPEQATGDVVDARSDVYSVGVLLYQMLTGRLPFGGDAIDQVRSHLVEPVPALERTSPSRRLDAALEALIRRAMAKRREDRFDNARAMLAALAQIRDHDGLGTLPPTAAPAQTLRNARRAFPPLAQTLSWLRALCVVAVIAQLLLIGLLLRDQQGTAALVSLAERSRVALSGLTEHSGRWGGRLAARWHGLPEAPLLAAESAHGDKERKPLAANPEAANKIQTPPGAQQLTAAGAVDERKDPTGAQQPTSAQQLTAAAANKVQAPTGAQQPTGVQQLTAAGAVDERKDPTGAQQPTGVQQLTAAGAIDDGQGSSSAAPWLAQREHGAGEPWPGPVTALPPTAAATPGLGSQPAPSEPATRPDAAPGAVLAPQPSGSPDSSFEHMAAVPGPPKPRNPWARGTPVELHGIRRSIQAGGAGDDRVAGLLRTYSQSHPGDPRAQLLLGMMYINRSWRADAVAQFASALKTDLSARGAPEVLETLTALVASGRAETEASALIMRAYGTEALPALATKIAAARAPDAAARLRTLRARIDRAQGTRR